MNTPHAKPATVPMRDAHQLRSDDWIDVVLPLAMALAGIGAALLERGPTTFVLLGVLLVLGVAGGWLGWRRLRAAAEVHRLMAEHRMLRESIENTPMPFAV